MPSFSLRLALAWTAFVTAALWLGLVLLVIAFPHASQSIVWLGLVQVFVYALVLGLFLKTVGGDARRTFALEPAPIGVCLVAFVLGLLLQVPGTLLTNAVEHFYPTAPSLLAERVARITPHSSLDACGIFLVVGVLGPLVEELFFRGALFGALRRGHPLSATTVTVALCFALGHLDPRALFPLFVVALALGEVRELSGSIWPGFALHSAFNSATLSVVFSGGSVDGAPPRMPLAVVIVGCAGSAALLYWLRARFASRALG